MNDKEILMEKDVEQQSDARVARHSVFGAMLAVLLCILLAGIVWVCVMNTQDTDFIPSVSRHRRAMNARFPWRALR